MKQGRSLGLLYALRSYMLSGQSEPCRQQPSGSSLFSELCPHPYHSVHKLKPQLPLSFIPPFASLSGFRASYLLNPCLDIL